jgi:hypothetical protein
MKVFGDVDRTDKGKIKSEFPAWYYPQQIDELKESIRHKERLIEQDMVPASEKQITKSRLAQEKERLTKIEEHMPKLTATEQDSVHKMTKELGNKIGISMFSRSEMERGTADAHEEARRMSEPCIEIKTEAEVELAKECNISIKNGKVSRDEASKMWKLSRRMLGEMSNVEILRRDK